VLGSVYQIIRQPVMPHGAARIRQLLAMFLQEAAKYKRWLW
jgi:hypothetical protein